MAGRKWSRSETLVAFSLYCCTPFGRLHARNPTIISTAERIGRTPDSLAMKCCNLASLDATHRLRGRAGLQKVSALDRTIWAEFEADPESLLSEADSAMNAAGIVQTEVTAAEETNDLQGTERERIIRVRVNQYLFRSIILSGYTGGCAVCGLPIPELLVASHIVPWSIDSQLRLNPRNGLCLCGTHDLAFERGVIRILEDYSIHVYVADEVRGDTTVSEYLMRYDGKMIQLPQRWPPNPEYLGRRLALVER